MRKKMLYVTQDGWWDTDINILSDLGKEYELEVYVMSPVSDADCKYPHKKLPDYIRLHDFKHQRSKYNPLMCFFSVWYFMKIYFASFNSITFILHDRNIFVWMLVNLLFRTKQTIISYHDFIPHVDTPKWEIMIQNWTLSKFKYFHLQSLSQYRFFKEKYPNKFSFYTDMAVKGFGNPLVTHRFFHNRSKTFLMFGVLREYKHPEMFIKTANKFKGKANFILAGSCNYWNKLKKIVNNDTSLICNIAYIPNEAIPNYYMQSDFLVLPYEDSTQSGPLLTAYYYNLPIIASNLEYFREMIDDNKTGFLFEVLNQDELDQKIERAINMPDDEYLLMKKLYCQKIKDYSEKTRFSEHVKNFILNYGL